MHWVLQSGFESERGIRDLVAFLERAQIPHSLHKVVPFVGELLPDISLEGNVIVFGSYSMRHVAKRKGWVPGSFDLANITYADHVEHWGNHMLNSDAIFCRFEDVPTHFGDEPKFLRPVVDSKFFTGKVMDREEFLEWHRKVVVLKDDYGDGVRADTMVLVATPKEIQQEYRLWVVDGEVATASLYKRGGKALYHSDVEERILEFAAARVREWKPARAFVLDVAVTEVGLYIIETNTLNAAGLYAADVCKLVGAIEAMSFLDNGTSTK